MKLLQFVFQTYQHSPMRILKHNELKKAKIGGKILDLGGVQDSSYMQLFSKPFTITTMNIEPKTKPTIQADITKKFPIEDQKFDAVVSFSTFEHIFNCQTTFKESFRVLKTGGIFLFSVPFLHQIHGSPDDFWRFSESTLERLLHENNFKIKKIQSLGTGLFMARYSLLHPILPRFTRPIIASWAYFLDSTLKIMFTKYRERCSEKTYPIGYFVIAQKSR